MTPSYKLPILPYRGIFPGQPATLCVGSDFYASKIAYVSKTLKTLRLEDGTTARLRPDGTYRTPGGVCKVLLGVAFDYRDPSF